IVGEIKDITLRNQYQLEFKERFFRLFRRSANRQLSGTPNVVRALPQGILAEAPPVSTRLAASPLFRTGKASLSPREGLILLLLLNHPGLISRYVEELAEVAFSSEDATALRDAMIAASDGCSGHATPGDVPSAPSTGGPPIRAILENRGFAGILQKLDATAAHGSHWYAKAEAAEADAEEVLKQALSLHRRAKALHRELQLAELALGKDSSETNLGRLKDIQAQLSALGGIEAAMEGFGAQSGHPRGTL
ncbi:MAG TPA: DNA primase, partial [Methylocella sp.]|nr:DNA primase [Methylocella sp.]